MLSSTITAFAGLVTFYVLLRFLQQYSHDVQEPPIVAGTIPFISPLIGMAKRTKFYTDLRDKYDLPIYTLRLPGSRIYVVNSIKLINAAQRQARILDFAPIETKAAVNVMGASPEGKEILSMNRNGTGNHSYAIEFDKAIHPALSPGASLDSINRSAVQKVTLFLDKLARKTPTTIKLYEWVQNEIAWATSEAVYGPENPFRDPELLKAFWTFEPGIVILLLQFFPSLLARESLQAREKLFHAFRAYFGKAGHERGSALIRARYNFSVDYGFSLDDIARFEVGGAVAILSNTIPTSFWLLWHIAADPVVLDDCRKELSRICKTDANTVTIDITEVKHSCPILVSAMQEVLRLHGAGTSVRVVQEDHLLNGEYLLKKGGTLMIPGPVQHTSKVIYGDDVHDFRHKRFLSQPGGKRPNPAGFRGFGGGSTLCPGRHFVSTEILAFVALTILRFDLKPVGGGTWIQPTTSKAGMQATVPPPDTDIDVEVTLREDEFVGKQWNTILRTSDKALGLVAEDLAR